MMSAFQIKRPETAFEKDKPARETRGRKPKKLEAHRAWIRTLPSLVTNRRGGVDCAHVSQPDPSAGKTSRGKGQKADDFFVVPLGRELHDELDRKLGWKAFQEKYRLDLVKIALALYAASGDDERAEMIIRETVR